MSTLALTNTNIFNVEDEFFLSYENKCKNLSLKNKVKKIERKIAYHENKDKISYKKKEISDFKVYNFKISDIFNKPYIQSMFRKASHIKGKCAEKRFFNLSNRIKNEYPELMIKSVVKTDYSLDIKGIDFIIIKNNGKNYFFQVKSSFMGFMKHFKKYRSNDIKVIIVNDNKSDEMIINKIINFINL